MAQTPSTTPVKKKEIQKKRTPIPTQEPYERTKNFNEVALGYSEEQALIEVNRCLQCPKRNCVAGCPVSVPIPEFIKLIRDRDYAGAILKIKEKNMLGAICGRVCPQETQCEEKCTLGKVKDSEPVAIGRLERFVADWTRIHHVGETKAFCEFPLGIKVAIIGAGPAGITCASELARQGYEVTVFEAFHEPGGVLVYGIPEFRLPKEIVRYEVQVVKNCGVKLELNHVMGKILSIDDLHQMGFEAIFVGVGAGLPTFQFIPGTELNGVLSANEFLTRNNLMKAYQFPKYDTMVDKGKQIAVIGGGNVAMDSARTALRLGAEKVMIIYRRSEKELPARREEYEHAVEEGIEFHFLRNPTKIIGNEKGFVKAIQIIKMELGEPDKSGRRSPIEIPGSEYTVDVDMVIMAIGTQANPLLTGATKGLKLNSKGYIEVNDKLQTSIPYVFAGGDIVTGSATVISAMGAGMKAAAGIHEYLLQLHPKK
jgi:glutamate synthase (NADPH/NADH) small chain